MVILFICIGLFVVIMLYFSERWGTTFGGTIWISTKTVLFWIKQMIPKKEIHYPSGIGYDVNGCFCPGAVEDEFSGLRDTLDGLYLSNHLYSNELFQYVFKFARVKNDISGIELYDYVDKKVVSIIQQFLHRLGNNVASDNISSITLDSTTLTVYIARNHDGERMNYDWKARQRISYYFRQNEAKKTRGAIEINWDEA